jgi:hypothetical protein
MVRGNWQKRVETAEARRREARQRKQRHEDKRQHRLRVLDCWELLDRHGRRPLKVHLWTDAPSSTGPPLLDVVDHRRGVEVGGGGGSSLAAGGGGSNNASIREARRRGRSGSLSEGKKVHPRSSAAASFSPSTAEDSGGALGEIDPLLLCRSHFFFGKCDESHRRKSGCRYLHYSSRYQTLASALLLGKSKSDKASHHSSNVDEPANRPQEDRVKLSEQAARAQVDAEDTQASIDAMEMVYYTCVELKEHLSSDHTPQRSLSEELTDALASGNVKLGSVVFLVVNNALVFDRNRDGVLLSDREFQVAVTGDGGGSIRESFGSRRASVGSEDEGGEMVEVKLPGSVLEHVLTFLPDSSVAAASGVCKAWHREIGRNSPDLWVHLLKRRGWPVPVGSSTGGDTRDACRLAFVQHYAAVRDLRAIQRGLLAIAFNKSNVEENELAYQDFSSRKGAPSQSSSGWCVSVQVWSPRSILAAYSRDCSLRLFEAVPRGGSSVGADGLLCRQIVCRRVDPYRNTKRRTCVMLSMGVDEESIGCLCHVMADSVDAEAYVLVVLSREDFLVGDDGSAKSIQDSNLRVIDIGEAVINYLLSSDVVDHRLLQLMDFLSSDGGEVGQVEVLVSRSVAACGYGRFMIEVSISIPTIGHRGGVDQDDTPMHLLDRKLVLFSLTAGAIVWMGDSYLSLPLRPRQEDMTLGSLLTLPFVGASRCACSVMVASSTTSDVLLVSIEPPFQVTSSRFSDTHGTTYSNDDWDLCSQPSRAMILVSSDAIAADVLRRTVSNRIVDRKSVIMFYPRFPTSVDTSVTNHLELEGGVEVERIASLGDRHILLLCRQYIPLGVESSQTNPDEVDSELPCQVCAVAILVHIKSRQEIHRVTLFDGVDPELFQLPEITSACHETIGVGLSWKGIIMTGSSVRSVAEPDILVLPGATEAVTNRSAKKKKKKMVPKGSKKDGFARGMSLRG